MSKYSLTITTSSMMKEIVSKYAYKTIDIPWSVSDIKTQYLSNKKFVKERFYLAKKYYDFVKSRTPIKGHENRKKLRFKL